ncbi:UbiA family prenyltransferase [Polaromonas sp. CG_9.11]|uniref:UbiA family prenyltransferase n=1 Tax=Polaromonas sp. CG_9.11 TaxID=2787730 RepID=UPI0018CBD17C|nr:UbiA family prenyltransferase [Polaromonas sp. CG_9.11]MBG6076299.1 4-hydroxybenzoate polyprenyltransferase [Polaromonas sp. CG_9.11]
MNVVQTPHATGLYARSCEPDAEGRSKDDGLATTRRSVPLVVDLDGTLTPTDTLVELLIKAVKHDPAILLKIPLWLIKGRAPFKQFIAQQAGIHFDAATLPYNQVFLDYLREEKAQGRLLILATAADSRIANSVAAHLGLFDTVLASDGTHNLKGDNKRLMIERTVGRPFAYAGDHAADLPIWKSAAAAVLVGVSPQVERTVREHCVVEQTFTGPSASMKSWLRALRMHQWIKNILLFVPVLTAFSLPDLQKLVTVGVAFLAFSLVASATYIVNDLLDLDSDRAHPRKRSRPFASAEIGLVDGAVISLVMLAGGLVIAGLVSGALLSTLLCYLVLTSAYTWLLKRYVLIDVLMLSVLYTLRILAGAVAANVSISSWLAAFSLFIFFSLALVKRCSELVSLSRAGGGMTKGRDYHVSDLPVLWPLGIGAALSAIVVFGLFINAHETQVRYESPHLLWGAAVVMIYWISRLWIKTGRAEMHDDPIIYSLTNFNSLICITVIVGLTMIAQFVPVGFP